MTYTPHEGSVAYKVLEFLTTNPDEELTSMDIGAKFDCASNGVHSMLARAVEVGALKRAPNDDEELTYTLGKGVPTIKPCKARAPSLSASAPWGEGDATARRGRPVMVDLDALKIDKGVPLVTSRGRQAVDWNTLFNRMEVNDSVALPKQVRGQLAKAAAAAKHAARGEFVIRQLDDDAIRVWRVK